MRAAFLWLLLWPATAFGQFALEVDPLPVQESPDTAYVSARWVYTYPAHWQIVYRYTVSGVLNDSTAADSVRLAIAKTDTDQALTFCVLMDRVSPEPVQGPETCKPFVVPARPAPPAYVLLASAAGVTTPTVVPHDPAMETPDGVVWLEFQAGADVTTQQGLFSKDHGGYGTGGHLTIYLNAGTVTARIQDTVQSYVLTGGPVVPSARNQIAFRFGAGGAELWLNGSQIGNNPYTGGVEGNTENLVVCATSWDQAAGSDFIADPCLGTLDVEFYAGDYDFSGRWAEPPEPPVPPADSLAIIVTYRRVYQDSTGTMIQYGFAPPVYRNIDYRIGLTESYFYAVYIDGQRVGYTAPASYGIVECHLAAAGEVCPTRPFRPGAGHLALLALPARGGLGRV